LLFDGLDFFCFVEEIFEFIELALLLDIVTVRVAGLQDNGNLQGASAYIS
jgi:hypothetical protein